jgi:hypothetical protein
MMLDFEPFYVFVIDTDSYAGNFERWMCGYITGEYMDHNHGNEEAKIYRQKESYDFANSVQLICETPVTIWPTEGWYNDGNGNEYKEGEGPSCETKHPVYRSVAIFFNEEPTEEEIQIMQRRAKEFLTYAASGKGIFKFDKPIINITGFRVQRAGMAYKTIKSF